MRITPRLMAGGIAIATMIGFAISPAEARTEYLQRQAIAAPTDACAFVAEVSVVMDGHTQTQGFDSVKGALIPRPSTTADGCGSVAAARAQSASPSNFGSKTFTAAAPTYTKSDADSTFNAQTNFVAGLPTAFGFKVSPALVAVAISPVSTANATRTPPNCTYNKPGVAVAYPFHWSCGKQTAEVEYNFAGKWVFRVEIGGQTGTATINWKFDYIIYTRIG